MIYGDEELLAKRLCCMCIGDTYLKSVAENKGKMTVCSYCGEKNKAATIKLIAELVDKGISGNYYRTSVDGADINNPYEYYDRPGVDITLCIEEEAMIPAEAAEDIRQVLADKHWDKHTMECMEEQAYAKDSQYEERSPESKHWQERWANLLKLSGKRTAAARKAIDKLLTEMFAELWNVSTFHKESVIITIGPGTGITKLARARVFTKREKLMKGLADPVSELGPPPASCATAGRMNKKGVPVFYGSEKKGAAVSEVRPPVGSFAVVAEFEILRHLRVLDLTMLEKAHSHGSIFHPDELARRQKIAFFKNLKELLTQPVMPGEEIEYIPAQLICEFLSDRAGMDGIRFPSVQGENGMNIVLFNKVATVEKLPYFIGQEVEVALGYEFEDFFKNHMIYITYPPGAEQVQPNPLAKPALRLKLDSIQICQIKSARYNYKEEEVIAHTYEAIDCTPIGLFGEMFSKR